MNNTSPFKMKDFLTEFYQSLFSVIKVILTSKWFLSYKKHQVNKGDCIILGNGPSLNEDLKENLKFILDRYKVCVNLFAFSNEYELIKPNYYVLAGPEFWLKNTIEFHVQQRAKLAKEIIEKTNWPMKILAPLMARNSEVYNKLITNKNIEFILYNSTPVEGLPFIINRIFKMNLGMPRPHNVLIPSIFLAINLGYGRIIIFGADHSWHEDIKIDANNTITVNHQHFFESDEKRMPMYKLDGEKYRMHDIFRKLYFSFKGYFILQNYAKYRKVQILNASSKSYIEAFDKVTIPS
jgi:hypothetical protein